MGKASDRVKRPFAPLERDVDPPLRKLAFVRARCVSSRDARRSIPAARARAPRPRSNERIPRRLSPIRPRFDSPRRRAVRSRSPSRVRAPLTLASSPRLFPRHRPPLARRRRRPDPPLISASAMKKMLVLEGGAGGGAGARDDARGARDDASAELDVASARRASGGPPSTRSGGSSLDPLYPREAITMRWPAARKVGAGLANLGNTCFMNSVMQCLTHTPPLAAYALAGEHKHHRRRTNSPNGGSFDALFEMGEHVCKALRAGSGGPAVAPVTFVKNLRSVSKTFRKGRQEDAHEFARCLLDAMHKRCVDAARPKPPEGSARAETSFVWRVFGGRLRSRVECATCGRKSDTFDSFMDVSLDVAGGCKSIAQALKRYVAIETLDGANKYKCEMGGPGRKPHMTRATKQFTVDVAPLVLTAQLKRFEYVPFGRGKLNQFVEYPLVLDVSAAMSDADANAKGEVTYELFGVLVHSGSSMHSGHYYCYVKGATGHWYEMDDESVTPCGEKTALRQRAYLLFYARRGTGLDGGERGSEKAVEETVQAMRRKNLEAKNDDEANPSEKASRASRGEESGSSSRRRKKIREETLAAEALAKTPKASKRASDDHARAKTKPPPLALERSESRRRREKPSAAAGDENVLLPSSPTGSDRSLSAMRSPRGKLLSSRDSARLRLAKNKLHLAKQRTFLTSPVKTRAAKKAEKAREATRAEATARRARRGDEAARARGEKASTEIAEASFEREANKQPAREANEQPARSTSAGKDARRWLNREAREANVVGRGGGRGGWDDDDDAEGGAAPGRERGSRPVASPRRKAPLLDEATPGKKRRRAYDEVDEEYDRGRVPKHARRKAEGGGVRRSGEAKAASKRAANPFQAAARRKAKS